MADIMVTLQKLANENTAKTFKYNTQEAKASRDWQTTMSNSAHQREVKDLVAAGLNPVLSSGGSGAQSYSTQSASGTADSAVNAIGNVQSSRNSAAATRYAADQSLKASQAMANAQMYAAQMSYEAQKYNADMNYKGKIETSTIGLANKYSNSILKSVFGKDADSLINSVGSGARDFWKSKKAEVVAKYNDFKNPYIAYDNMSSYAKNKVYDLLEMRGYAVTDFNVGMFGLFVMSGDKRYLNALKKANSHYKRMSGNRSSGGIW